MSALDAKFPSPLYFAKNPTAPRVPTSRKLPTSRGETPSAAFGPSLRFSTSYVVHHRGLLSWIWKEPSSTAGIVRPTRDKQCQNRHSGPEAPFGRPGSCGRPVLPYSQLFRAHDGSGIVGVVLKTPCRALVLIAKLLSHTVSVPFQHELDGGELDIPHALEGDATPVMFPANGPMGGLAMIRARSSGRALYRPSGSLNRRSSSHFQRKSLI